MGLEPVSRSIDEATAEATAGATAQQSPVSWQREGSVWVIRMSSGDNRFNRDSLAAWHTALDEVAASEQPTALVTTGLGKFYSNGLDLDWMGANPSQAGECVKDVHRLLGRVLGLSMITVAAVNGHAFAAGAMLTCAHDYVVMRSDRGYWCLPEVDLGLPLTPAMYAIVAARLAKPTLAEAILTGKRYTSAEAIAAGVVSEEAPEADVLDRAMELASSFASKNSSVVAEHKRLMYGEALGLCARS